MFSVAISGADWPDPSPQFGDRDSAIGHARGVLGRLVETGAPDDATVSILYGDDLDAVYSIASWRLAVLFIGDRVYL